MAVSYENFRALGIRGGHSPSTGRSEWEGFIPMLQLRFERESRKSGNIRDDSEPYRHDGTLRGPAANSA